MDTTSQSEKKSGLVQFLRLRSDQIKATRMGQLVQRFDVVAAEVYGFARVLLKDKDCRSVFQENWQQLTQEIDPALRKRPEDNLFLYQMTIKSVLDKASPVFALANEKLNQAVPSSVAKMKLFDHRFSRPNKMQDFMNAVTWVVNSLLPDDEEQIYARKARQAKDNLDNSRKAYTLPTPDQL